MTSPTTRESNAARKRKQRESRKIYLDAAGVADADALLTAFKNHPDQKKVITFLSSLKKGSQS